MQRTSHLEFSIVISLALSTGCPSDDADDAGAAETSAADSGDESGSGTDDAAAIAALYDCEEPMLLVVQPLAGPGIDPQTGAMIEPQQERYVVSTTQIMLKPGADVEQEFFRLTGNVQAQLAETEGVLAVSLAAEPTCGFYRTLTVWTSEAAMYKFVTAGAHVEAMSQTSSVAATARVAHWEASADAMPPTWDDAIVGIADAPPFGDY